MADIALVWRDGHGVPVMAGAALLTDDSVMTSVIISLFTDRRAMDSDELPDGTEDRRGWWGDSFRTRPVGSRLWLLNREKSLQSVVSRVQAYADEALEWMVTDGAATAVTCTASRTGDSTLSLSVQITLPDGAVRPVFFYAETGGSQ
ncbi:TPA: hypothetical protein JZG45_000809 [Escherichia coli]|nr:hypothetical protein [Escherichia coli]